MVEKDLLEIKSLSQKDITEILNLASDMKKILSGEKYSNILKGKTVITIFFEPSTRTRLSFELAAKYLGAHYGNIEVSTSSVAKGESLIDTVRTVEMMKADVVITRHNMSGTPHMLSKYTNMSIVNAGDGINEHPTQALLDMMTIKEKKGTLKGLKVTIVGDIMHSRVARSNIWGFKKMGSEVAVCAPSTLMPSQIEKMGVKAYNNIEEAANDADVVMGLRIQLERQKGGLFPTVDEYKEYFGINERILKLAKPDVLLMHPGPINRNVEVTAQAANSRYSVIEEQVTNGVAVRMAILKILCERRN